MSNLWKLQRRLVAEQNAAPYEWPAEVELKLMLQPQDFFKAPTTDLPRTTINGTTQFQIDGRTGKFLVLETQQIEPIALQGKFQTGEISVKGNIVHLKTRAADAAHLEATLNWVTTDLAPEKRIPC